MVPSCSRRHPAKKQSVYDDKFLLSEKSGSSAASDLQKVSSRKNLLRLRSAIIAPMALLVVSASACGQTKSETDVKTYGVDSIAKLKAVDPVADQRIIGLGCHLPRDGGGGLFRYVGDHDHPADDSTVISSSRGSGQWLGIFEGPINVRWFGARWNGGANDRGATQAAINAARPGDTVYLPRGQYAVSKAIVASKRMVTIDFEGTLVLHGSYDDVLFKIVGDKDTRLRAEPTETTVGYGSYPKIDIKALWLDGKSQSRGFFAQYVDRFSWSKVFISRNNSYAVKLTQVREADIYNLTLDRVSGQMRGEANFFTSGDHPTGDAANNIRIWGINTVYPGGRAVKIGCGPKNEVINGPVRNIFFYGAQIHYLREQGLSYTPTENNIRFITLDNCRSINFEACNLHLGDTSQGTLISIGSEASAGSTAGATTTGSQSFAGNKTFTQHHVVDGRSLRPSAVQTVDEGIQINSGRSFVQISSTADGTVTATPSGLTVVRVGSHTIMLQRRDVLAESKPDMPLTVECSGRTVGGSTSSGARFWGLGA